MTAENQPSEESSVDTHEKQAFIHQNDARCPICGGTLKTGEATVPYVLQQDMVVVVKNVPAIICTDCREPFMSGKVTDRIVEMLEQLKSLGSEISVVSYQEYEPA